MSKNVSLGTFKTSKAINQMVSSILKTGQISYNKYSKDFEARFAELHNTRFAVISNSGTSSLLVALECLKEYHNWADGDEVLVPGVTFVATVNIILQAGLKPVLVDVEPDYYGINTDHLEMYLRPETRAIIPVHTFGQPCDMLQVMNFANRHNLLVIEDSCEAMFVKHYDKPVGSWGHIACFSTYMAHLLTTGVGGLSLTSNKDYARLMRSYVNHGLSYDDLSEDDNGFNPRKTRRDFTFDRVGYSFRLTEFEAALGLGQLQTYQDMLIDRQTNAHYLTKGLFQHLDLQLPALRPNTEHSWMMYPIIALRPGLRQELMNYLEKKGIESRRMLPLVSQPVYKGLWEPNGYPVSKWIEENGFYIGCHQDLTKNDLDRVLQAFEDFLK